MSTAVEVETSNPFPGLRPFREQEEYLFFGRENQVDAMVDKLAAARFLAVVGTSGSGKSSLVNCGLRPALHRGLMSAAGTAWRMVQFRPGGKPLAAMTSALTADGALYSGYRGDIPLSEVIDTPLRLSKRGLIDVFRRARLPNGINLLVVVDQFEELFRYRAIGDAESASGERSQEAAAFVNLLLEAKQQADFPIYVVLTMRSDFLGSCAEFPGLPEAVNEGQYLVPRMTRDERRAAIRGPVGVGGAEITPVLLTRLVNDVGDNPDQLSILQHALNRTWSRWRNEGRGEGPLDLPHYEAIGTMAHALDQHAEKTYGELKSDRAKKCCEKIFKALTDKGTDPRGIRRPTDFKTLCALASASPAEVVEVIDVFRKPSRSFLMPPLPEVPGQDTVIDISHESLMRVWERLKAWADEEAQSAQLYRRLSETAAFYAAGKAGLWRDPDLQVAIDWRNKEEPTAVWAGLYRVGFAQAMDFLAESEALREKETREKEESQRRELQHAQDLAEEQRRRAKEQARAAQRLRKWVVGAAALALAAFAGLFIASYEWKKAKASAVEAGKSAAQAQASAVEAQYNEKEAQFNREKAEKKEKEANDNLAKADEARKDAEHEARRNLSHELAGASESLLSSDPGLSLLLAIEAVSTTYRADKAVEKEAEESLQQAVQASQNRLLSSGHTKTVRAVAYSPTEPRLATASEDGTVKVWDATTGLRLLTLSGHDGPVNAVAFSLPDGKYLATAGDDKTVKLWEARSGKQVQTLGAHAGPVNALAFSPNGKRLATASKDGSARVWDFRAGALGGNPLTFSGHTDEVRGVAFSPDGKYLATASLDGTTKVWDTATPKNPPSTFSANPNPSKDKDAMYAVDFSPDGQHLATAGQDRIIRVWDATDPNKPLLQTPSNHTTEVRAVAFSKDGKQLATAGDKTARVWDVSASDGKNITLGKERTLSGHTEPVLGVAFNSNGKQVATASADKTSRVWDASYGQELLELSDVSVKETVLALSTDGKLVAASGSDGSIRLFDGVSGLELFTLLPSTTTRSPKMAFAPGGQYLAAIISGERAHVWRMSDGREVFMLPIGDVPDALAISKGGNRLATMTGKDLKVWDAGSKQSSALPTNYTGHYPVVAFSPDDKYLAATSADRKVTIWDTSLGRSQRELSHPDIVDALSFSPDSKRLVTASRDNTVRFWDVQSGDEVRPLQTQINGVYQIAFSPNGLMLATLSRDGNLKVWRVGKGETEEKLGLVVVGLKAAQSGYPGRLGFHPDGDLITATRDMIISEYPLTIEELMVFARRRVSRPWTDEQCHHYLHREPCPSETLQVDPREETKELQAEALLASGRNLASVGNWEDAQANFQRALALDPELHFNQGLAAQHLAGPALAAKGRNLARSEDRDGAVASFRQAKNLDSSLSLDPETEADKWMAESLYAKGITLADWGNIDEATKSFQEAQRRAPERDKGRMAKDEATALRKAGTSLAKSENVDGAKKAFREAETLDPKPGKNLDPEKEANRLVAEILQESGTSKAKSGDVEGAKKAFQEAEALDPTREKKLDPETEANRLMAETLLADAGRLVKQEGTFKQGQDDYLKAVSVYKNVEELDRDGKIRADALNDLCWNGSLLGHAAEAKVMDACEQAVKLDPKNADNYDSRGLARALTNNYSGAISDFQFFINNAPSNREKYRQDRKDWVEALRKGQNPFTPEVLKKMLAG